VGPFGERLRREREMRGVALDDIAEATKIGTRLLRALEEEHFELLPGGIFNKGFVRAYAKYLGLNEEEAVADYLAAAGEAVPDPRVIAEQNSSRIDRSGGDSHSPRQTGFPVIPVLILLLVIAAGAGGWQIYQERVRDRESRRLAGGSGPTTAPAAIGTPAPANPAETTTSTSPVSSTTKVETPGTTTAANQNISVQASPTTTTTGDLNVPAPKSGDVTTIKQAAPLSDITKLNATATPNPELSRGGASVASNQTFEVTVRAKDRAWVAIKSDGKFAIRGIIGPPDVKTIHATEQIVFWTGNAGAVEVSFNGQPVPLAGGPNQEGVLVFNSHGTVSAKPAQ